ncbi:hypothetical protein HDU77_005821 [Chytriomyces hyalinus]|nr:hypothetical protein HDU77_005821 [Chytriomyces hyalinus]
MTDPQWDSLRTALSQSIQDGYGPLFVRLAYHDAATAGGAHAQQLITNRRSFHSSELALLDSIKSSFPAITFADLVSFAGALSVSAMGGPKINWRSGRNDAKDFQDAPVDPAAPIPNGTENVNQFRAYFTRIGFTSDRDMVALMGAHNLGNCHIWKTGYAGPWSSTPFNLTNEYFKLLQTPSNYKIEVVLSDFGTKDQWIDNAGRMMLPVDMALTRDESFVKIINEYAANQDTFFADFASAYGRLLEHNVSPGLSKDAISTDSPPVVAAAVSKPANSSCYPSIGSPIFCVDMVDSGNDVIFTVHTNRQGWVGVGVGSGSMTNNDVIVGYKGSSDKGDFQTSRFTTVQHKITPNSKSAWLQIPLRVPSDKPSWATLSFSAVHRKVIESTTGLVGNNLNGYVTFAVSDFAPDGNNNAVDGVTTLYQHDISAILLKGTGGPTMVGNDTASSSLSVGAIAGIAAGAAVVVILVVLAVIFRKRMFSRGTKAPNHEAPNAASPDTAQPDNSVWVKTQTARKLEAAPLSTGSSSSAGDSAPPSFLPDMSIGGSSGSTYGLDEAAENAAFEQQLKQYLDGNATPPEDPLTWDRAASAYFVMKNGGSSNCLLCNEKWRQPCQCDAGARREVTDLFFELGIERTGDKIIFANAMLALRERAGVTNGVTKQPPAYI